MDIRQAFINVVVKLTESRLAKAKKAYRAMQYEFYIEDVAKLTVLTRVMVCTEDPIDAINQTITGGLRELVISELVEHGLVEG